MEVVASLQFDATAQQQVGGVWQQEGGVWQSRCVVCGSRCVVCGRAGVWCVAAGVWCVAAGVWCVTTMWCGVWSMLIHRVYSKVYCTVWIGYD